MSFERLIEYANAQYAREGKAVIEKQHTKFLPIRNRSGQVVSCKVEEKATVDFMGRYRDTPIAFEAKHCAEDVIQLKRVEPHQSEFLRRWTAQGAGIGFVLISFQLLDFYLVPWPYWEAAAQAREQKTKETITIQPMGTPFTTTAKASIRKDELPEEWAVKSSNMAPLDFLGKVDAMWKGTI